MPVTVEVIDCSLNFMNCVVRMPRAHNYNEGGSKKTVMGTGAHYYMFMIYGNEAYLLLLMYIFIHIFIAKQC